MYDEQIVEDYIELKTKMFVKSTEGYIDNIDEDFSNALDVLKCYLHERNHNLITELQAVFEQNTNLILSAYRSGLIDGISHKDVTSS